MENSDEFINERIKMVRKTLNLTQVEFAKKLGIHGGSVSTIELGGSVTEQNIGLICTPNRFIDGKAVNENWLFRGEGEMFQETIYISPEETYKIMVDLYENNPLIESESTFSLRELLKDKWDSYSHGDKTILGRTFYTRVKDGKFNKNGWVVKEILHTKPQCYRTEREEKENPLLKRTFLNEIPGLDVIDLNIYIKGLIEQGKWIEILDNNPYTKNKEKMYEDFTSPNKR